jgi:hypothetical protein
MSVTLSIPQDKYEAWKASFPEFVETWEASLPEFIKVTDPKIVDNDARVKFGFR